jgi:hypothetical protein
MAEPSNAPPDSASFTANDNDKRLIVTLHRVEVFAVGRCTDNLKATFSSIC